MEVPVFSTADTILTQVRAETGVGSTPTSTALQNTAMLRRLHDANEEGVNYPYRNGILGWSFLVKEGIISTIANTTLDGTIASGATSVILTLGTNFDDPAGTDIGAFYIESDKYNADFGSYLDKSTHTLSSVVGIQLAHTDDSEVHKIYKLDSDFGKIKNVFFEGVSEYFYLDDNRRQLPPTRHFSLKYLTNTTYSGTFMVFPRGIGAHEFKYHYVKKATTITAITDSVDMPDGAGRRFLIERMKEYVWNVLGEENDAAIASQRAERAIRECADKWITAQVTPTSHITLAW